MREILVISGKGGTGKTTITAALAASGPAKVIADCDVDAADLHLIARPDDTATTPFYSGQRAVFDSELCTQCGICQGKCRFNAIGSGVRHRAELCEGCGLCAYVCPAGAIRMTERLCGEWYHSVSRFGPMVHAALGIGEENSGKLVTTVRTESGKVAKEQGLEIILTDGPPGIGCPVIASLTNTDLALLVTEPTRSALHDLERIAELTRHFRVPAAVVLNKADIHAGLADEVRAWCRQANIPLLAEFGWSDDCTRAQLLGLTLVEFRREAWLPVFESLWRDMLALTQGGQPLPA
ncbi:ATP-binding protein [Desulfovibrio mangrovi]|uniref:ATP-binding protein n=1 Tax=Desulfovibrio mangrovi TaxID=2976983 RepID=UPI002245E648|nr:ATP-binding protein [Desulfovibrio mangrovi]UZP67434.1 ATP-binding protein [Desulfovibrio mangrovi]